MVKKHKNTVKYLTGRQFAWNAKSCFLRKIKKYHQSFSAELALRVVLKVYRSVVLPTLLYACETWTVYQRHAKRLNHFHTSCLRKLLKIKWQDRIPDTEVLKRAGMQSIHTLLKLAQLRWTGHITRMPDERLPKKILYGELQVGKRSHGGQKKRYKDTLKASLKDFNIPTESWEQIAQDRTKWLGRITRGPRATVRSPE